MAPNGKKKAGSPSFDDVEAKRVEMVKSLSAVADAFEAATSSVRAYLECAPHALTEPAASATDGSKKRKAVKEKKVKDPNAPKRPVTGYLAYSKDQMPKLKEANPEMPHKVLVGLITEQWANLPEEEKKVYNDTFSAAMAEWKGKTAEYKEHHENGSAPAASAEATKPAAAKPAAAEAQSGDEAGSDDDESASTASSDSSDSSETEEGDAKPQEADGSDEEEEEEDVPQPPAKRTKRDAPAATPSKSQQKPKSSSAAAVPTSSAKKAAATPSAETSKKDKKSKKTEAAPPSSEETPAKKRGRKPKAQ
ncbi:hypothetical protein QFC20_001021 [Naganishia adeliensis]|uniref:Uncharacterized protein n=1 Tax=Naganishia adeliensis TaxID=92952 RepID=A0ACC2WX35_9TREE|nr:hypothetical protein QFC20_001021 [Naganishia adeliensis]